LNVALAWHSNAVILQWSTWFELALGAENLDHTVQNRAANLYTGQVGEFAQSGALLEF
jgi:hypothetical protein